MATTSQSFLYKDHRCRNIERDTVIFPHYIMWCRTHSDANRTTESEKVKRKYPDHNRLQLSHYSLLLYILFHTSASPYPQGTKRTSLSHLPFSRVYEHFDGNGKCREFVEVPRHKARAAESKSNLWCSCCIENSFRLRRLTPNGGERQRGRQKGERKEERGISSWRVDIVISDLCST